MYIKALKGSGVIDGLEPPYLSNLSSKVIDLFIHSLTQWEYKQGGMDIPIKKGLNYNAILTVAKILGIRVTKKVFKLLQVAENKAIEIEYKEREKQ